MSWTYQPCALQTAGTPFEACHSCAAFAWWCAGPACCLCSSCRHSNTMKTCGRHCMNQCNRHNSPGDACSLHLDCLGWGRQWHVPCTARQSELSYSSGAWPDCTRPSQTWGLVFSAFHPVLLASPCLDHRAGSSTGADEWLSAASSGLPKVR